MNPFTTSIALFLFALSSGWARASLIDEIQVYDDAMNERGKFGLELHVNSTLRGRSEPDYQGEITPNHGVRATAEFSYGLTPDLELGWYIPVEYQPGGKLYLPGLKLRLKWIPLHSDEREGGWFAGSNGELSRLAYRFSDSQWSFESRNIVGWRHQDWLISSNLVFGWALSGASKSARPDFEEDIKIAKTVARGIAVGPEYYSGFGSLGRPSAYDQQEHTLFAAIDIDRKPIVFNFGIGRGLTHAADRWTVKAIFELPWRIQPRAGGT